MEKSEFVRKVGEASARLRSLCSTGEPTETQVIEATKSAGLPVTFEDDSFVIDPVRNAVFVRAYNVPLRAGWTSERFFDHVWGWYTTKRPTTA